jgi:hypothetical protein
LGQLLANSDEKINEKIKVLGIGPAKRTFLGSENDLDVVGIASMYWSNLREREQSLSYKNPIQNRCIISVFTR